MVSPYSGIMPGRTAICILIAALASGCGFVTGDILAGTWRLDSYSCDGTRYAVPNGVSFTVSYGGPSGSTVAVVFDVDGTCRIENTGQYGRTGLTVTESIREQECFAGCTTPTFPPTNQTISCSGLTSFSTPVQMTYLADVPERSVLEQSRFTQVTFCPDGSSELRTYSRVD